MNWVDFLDDNQVNFVSRGPNTRRGEISVQCPWCGEDDPSQHMGINLESDKWGCHRDVEHRGKNPVRLVQALLGCSWSAAKLVVAQYSRADPETLEGALAALTGAPEAPPAAEAPPSLPDEFTHIRPGSRFWRYLENRGFSPVQRLVSTYDLMCCTTGRYKDRIIIPVYARQTLIGWTGRALTKPVNAPRYLSSSAAIKQTLLNHQLLTGGRLLFVCEGPFDALKLDFYGASLEAHATCVFGASMTEAQIVKITQLSKSYQQVVVLFDHDAISQAFYALDWLPRQNIVIGRVPEGFKDPGELDRLSVKTLISQYCTLLS